MRSLFSAPPWRVRSTPEHGAWLNVQLSDNFTLAELVRSQTAIRDNIDNRPDAQVTNNLRVLVGNVLQPARNALGPIFVNSGYRCKKLNTAIGGAKRSDHMTGKAADIEPASGVTLEELGAWIQTNCQFKRLIYEFGAWIHVSYDPLDLRCEVMEAYKHGKKTRYRPFSFLD